MHQQYTIEEIKKNRRNARIELKKIQKEAEIHREKELEGRAEAYIEEGKLPMGMALKILIEQEKVRKEYSVVQRELERKKYSSLKRLIVPGTKYIDAEGITQELPSNVYTDQETIHNLLIDRNIKHFSQAKDTPQGINGFIYNALGPHRTSDFSDRVLEGNMTED